jgi:hypothetical protein
MGTPTNFVDGVGDGADGGLGIVAPEEVSIAPVPPLKSTTQQSAEGVFCNTPSLCTDIVHARHNAASPVAAVSASSLLLSNRQGSWFSSSQFRLLNLLLSNQLERR